MRVKLAKKFSKTFHASTEKFLTRSPKWKKEKIEIRSERTYKVISFVLNVVLFIQTLLICYNYMLKTKLGGLYRFLDTKHFDIEASPFATNKRHL